MHIEKSAVQLHASHHSSREESFALVQSQQFTEMFDLAAKRLALPEQANGNAENAFGPLLVMTEEGLKFRTQEAEQQTDWQQLQTEARLFKALYRALTGKDLPDSVADDVPVSAAALHSDKDYAAGRVQRSAATDFLGREVALQVEVSLTHRVTEEECTTFNACGVVQTADGRSIDLNLNLTMSRSFTSESSISLMQEVRFKDPLLVNYEGNAAELAQTQMAFDIDVDGTPEWLSHLADNQGWLAWDKNADGTINDGSELFGAQSGDGFWELAQHDDDGNGFIDEADMIYSSLRLWEKTAEQDRLVSLSERDVGAIYLNASDTPFMLKGSANETQGRVQKSSFYLTESGGAGLVQQVDMAV